MSTDAAATATTTTTTTTTRKRARKQLQKTDDDVTFTFNDNTDDEALQLLRPAKRTKTEIKQHLASFSVYANGSISLQLINEGECYPEGEQEFARYSDAYIFLRQRGIPFFAHLGLLQTSASACVKRHGVKWADKNVTFDSIMLTINDEDVNLPFENRACWLIIKMKQHPAAELPPPPNRNAAVTTTPATKPVEMTFTLNFSTAGELQQHDSDEWKFKLIC
jgi:hypothetical protein